MPMVWTIVANVEPILVVAIAVGTLAIGLYLGIFLASRWYRGNPEEDNGEQAAAPNGSEKVAAAHAGQPDLTNEEEYFELWERLLELCYHDFRIQAVAGYDRGFFETLHEPLISEADEDDSPLLPGEIAFGEVRNLQQLYEYWKRRRPIYMQATEAMQVEEQALYRHCLDDALASLGTVAEQQRLYRLVVRTPGRQHIVLLPFELREVFCVVPGPPGFDDPFF